MCNQIRNQCGYQWLLSDHFSKFIIISVSTEVNFEDLFGDTYTYVYFMACVSRYTHAMPDKYMHVQ